MKAPYSSILGGTYSPAGTTENPGDIPEEEKPIKKKPETSGFGSVLGGDAANSDNEGGVQHSQEQKDTQAGAGKIDDFENWKNAVETGMSAVPSPNPAMAGAGAIAFANNALNGNFSKANGNWNSVPGYEAKVKELLSKNPNMSATAAQNAVAKEMLKAGKVPDGYRGPIGDAIEPKPTSVQNQNPSAGAEAGRNPNGGGNKTGGDPADKDKKKGDKPAAAGATKGGGKANPGNTNF